MVGENEEDPIESAFVEKTQILKKDKDKLSGWLVDSGASKCMTCDKEILQDYQQF